MGSVVAGAAAVAQAMKGWFIWCGEGLGRNVHLENLKPCPRKASPKEVLTQTKYRDLIH